ncbi:hypothetical protein AAVH_16559, partial [Aphelenchoides avenae]
PGRLRDAHFDAIHSRRRCAHHQKAKALVADDAFEARKAEILAMETRRADVYLLEPHRSDYVATITELFGLGDEKFQRR